MSYLLSLIGITLLCAGWVKFQLWLRQVDPDRQNFHPGCGACQSGSCGTEAESEYRTNKINQINPSKEAGFAANFSGVDECSVKKSPS